MSFLAAGFFMSFVLFFPLQMLIYAHSLPRIVADTVRTESECIEITVVCTFFS